MIIMTYNVRYSNEIDGRHSWDNRKALLVGTILDISPEVLSLQEAKPDQLEYIDVKLAEYERAGEGRYKNGEPDEHCSIYYKKELFKLIETKTLWYSNTPEVPGSMGWDTTQPRMYTYVILKSKKGGHEFVVMNTHLEHKGHIARLKSVGMLLEKAKSFGGYPVVVTGDFNLQEDYPGYKLLSEDGYLKDSRYISESAPAGPSISTNGFGAFEQKTAIDYVWVNDGFMVNSHETIENRQDDFYPSDHYPIICDIVPSNH